ncbi:MAG: polysaccharide deacetylase family protein [Candidatus Riflebacteria bacterium]|nr:polysaccharide deacetylase family protein [Candidatus Riflebacteria bacterium]
MNHTKTAAAVVLAAVFCFCGAALLAQTNLAALAASYPHNPEVLNSYGIELANRGDLIGAITVWRRALDYDRNNVHLYNNIGSALKRLGHNEQAYAWYAAALKLKPVYWTYYNLAILYRDCGQIKDACWALDQSLRLNPQFTQAIELRERIIPPSQTAATGQQSVKVPESFPASALVSQSGNRKIATAPATKPVLPAMPVKGSLPVRSDVAIMSHTTVVRKPPRPADASVSPLAVDAGGQVFLTFDGGATDAGFDSIVDSLQRYGIKCTFFLTGKFVEHYPEKSCRLLAEGHEIANHSMNHPNMKNFSVEKISAEIEAAETAFVKVLGRRGAPFFRFPFGAQNKKVEQLVEDLGYHPVYWHIDTIDWREDPVNTIISRVDGKLRRNAVILMHLGSKNGSKALDRILDIIIGRGFTLARLSDLDASQLAALP